MAKVFSMCNSRTWGPGVNSELGRREEVKMEMRPSNTAQGREQQLRGSQRQQWPGLQNRRAAIPMNAACTQTPRCCKPSYSTRTRVCTHTYTHTARVCRVRNQARHHHPQEAKTPF